MSNKNWFTSGNIERIVVGAENNLASTAGAIAHSIRKNGRCIVETIGAAAEYIGTKCIITARSMLKGGEVSHERIHDTCDRV